MLSASSWQADLEEGVQPSHRLPALRMARNITVLLVDDHALARRGFLRLLEDDGDIRVVGEADHGIRGTDSEHCADGLQLITFK